MYINCEKCNNVVGGCDYCRPYFLPGMVQGKPPQRPDPPVPQKPPEPEAFNPKNCKKIVDTPHEYFKRRQCARKLWVDHPEDGYCAQHHPDTLERERIEMEKQDERQQLLLHFKEVGRWLWANDKDRFCDIAKKLNERIERVYTKPKSPR